MDHMLIVSLSFFGKETIPDEVGGRINVDWGNNGEKPILMTREAALKKQRSYPMNYRALEIPAGLVIAPTVEDVELTPLNEDVPPPDLEYPQEPVIVVKPTRTRSPNGTRKAKGKK